jgi:hypothetical protein
MAITGLDLPIDIPWERLCVTRDMLDPATTAAAMPPLWQTSIAIYRYVPPDESQVYPNRRLVYYKVTCTITNYQPKSEQITGLIEAGEFTSGYMLDAEVQRRLSTSLPCTAAVVQVSVSPSETGKPVEAFPYFIDAQPRQRVLYEQVTEGQERASRSLEGLQIRKSAGTSESQEVLDVDTGGGVNVGVGGVGVGGQRSGEWGSKSMSKQDADRITTTDGSREQRETVSFTTQLSQMYTLLQAYHLGTNRVFFYITPRPHVVEPPTGIAGPRKLDGIQDLFLIVSQAKGDALPCITARLDTGHLSILPTFDFDRSQPPQILTLDIPAPAPLTNDPSQIATTDGNDAAYNCFFKSVTASNDLTAPPGFIIENTADIENIATGRPSVTNTSSVVMSPDRRMLTIRGTATGYACHRGIGGDIGNVLTVGPLRHVGLEPWPDTKGAEAGHVRRSVRADFRSELPSKKVGEQYALALTMRQLTCCGAAKEVPPKLVTVVPIDVYEIEPIEPGPAPRFTLATANDLQRRIGEETLRLSSAIPDAAAAPAQDDAFVMETLMAGAIGDPRRRQAMTASAESAGLTKSEVAKLAEALGRSGQTLSRADVLGIPDAVMTSVLETSRTSLMRLRLAAAGIPIRTRDKTPGPAAPAQTAARPSPAKPSSRKRRRS